MRTKQTSKRLRTIRRHRLVLALTTALAAPAVMAQATGGCADCLPRYGQVVSGSATSNYSASGVIRPGTGTTPTTMTISQTTRGAIIDWGTFNIANGYAVQITTPDASGVTLNRVVGFLGPGYGVSSSLIDGGLTSNGSVFLINPAGITFGSGAVVNVGGLVASTLWMNSGDFLNGLSTGQYVFNGFNGDPAETHQVRNDGSITAGAGGVAFVGPTLYNGGAITVNGGTAGFAAGTAVTLDFVGDGLTQVTVTAPPTEDSGIAQDQSGSITADGGRILLRTAATAAGTGGVIYAGGTLRARSIANVNGRVELTSAGGPVMLGAPGIFSDTRAPFTSGTIDVTGDIGEAGGSVLIQGNDIMLVNNDGDPLNPVPESTGSLIDASGGLGGGQVTLQSSGDVTLLPLSRILANGATGPGGQVQIAAVGNVFQWGDISASSVVGDGGGIGIGSTTGSVAIIGNLSASGGGNGGSISLFAANGLLGIGGFVGADGLGGNGGQVLGIADTFLQGADSRISADGAAGTGGRVALGAASSFIAYGRLSARGNTVGGTITTATAGDFDVQGLRVDAGASAGAAGTWTFIAPDITVVDGNDAGPVDGVTQLGTDLQDAEINTALANGTNVTLRAGTNADDSGFLHFSDGVSIVHGGSMALQFRGDAQGAISGSNFGIVAGNGALSMAFNADAGNLNNGFAGIRFDGATLDSNGGDILFYGQSDAASGFASSYDSGIALFDSSIDSGGGNVLMRGSSTGADAGGFDAGVRVEGTSIDAGVGGVSIFGVGAGATSGVILDSSDIVAGSGGVLVDGRSAAATGVIATATSILANGGPIALTGIGGTRGVVFDGGLYSGGGNIDVHGEGGSGEGIDGAGPVDSDGGDITMFGRSASAIGLDFGSGANSGMLSAGGAISLTGIGVTGGVALRESTAPVLLFAPGDVDRINSGGGALTVTGTASGAGATGVLVDGVSLVGGTGDVTVDGSAPLGIGVLFANGASASTTTGAITLIGEGANFGLDIADGAIDTDSGDLTLVGTALAAGATAGVRVTGGGLTTDGGSISVTGNSAGGVGVQLGSTAPFAIGSGGGDISVTGTGVTAGVWMIGNTVDSGGGAIDVTGAASGAGATGVLLDASRLIGGAGAITVDGSAPLGTGVLFANGSSATTTSGAITLIGEGADFGLDIANGAIDTDSGDLTLIGDALAAGATAGVRVTGGGLTTDGGNISVTGTSAGGVGVQLGGRGPFALGSGGGDISVTGTGVTAGVSMVGTTADSGGGAIDVTGVASGAGATGVLLDATRLIGGAGAILVDGSAPLGAGVLFANGSGASTTSGAITLIGEGATFGLDIANGAIDTTTGDLTLIGDALAAGATAGVRVTGNGLTTGGGDISVTGTSAGGVGVLLGNGGAFAIGSGGGAIDITGSGVTAGVRLIGNTANSGGGAIGITGTASGAGATGVLLDASRLIGGAGAVAVAGAAPLGTGVLFANGSSASTTSGAITLIGEGANFGVDLTDGAVRTVSGDLTLVGDALGASAIAGVRVSSGDLTTAGGDITVTGTTPGTSGVGVQLGDGSPIALRSGGGAIAITGSGSTGVLMVRSGSQVDSAGGAIAITGDGTRMGVDLEGISIASGAGDIGITGTASGLGAIGLLIDASSVSATAGDIVARGTAPAGYGFIVPRGASFSTTSGGINLIGLGANAGLDADTASVATGTGDILLEGTATSTSGPGVQVGGGNLTTQGGDIVVRGSSVGGSGVLLGGGGGFPAGSSTITIGSGGGAIDITGSGVFAGVALRSSQVSSSGGAIHVAGTASGNGGDGVSLSTSLLNGGAGDVDVDGFAVNGTGVRFENQSGITTTTGDISVTGIGANVGLALSGGELSTGSGHIDLRGRGTGTASEGLVIGQGVRVATAEGGIDLSGEGVGGAGVSIGTGASVDAGNSLVVVRAANNGASDAIRIGGTITSALGVNLRPGGVDANGGLTERTGDTILVGGGTAGFALSGTELALVSAPQLVIGSDRHAAAIQVLGGVTRNGNLTLQNDGGNGGIAIGGALNVGDNVLALSSGGSITQTSAGAITARSLLARAGGDVLLAAASNNVAANTLAGSAGGRFEYQDVDALAIGNVSAVGFDANANGLSNLSASGISAGGDVFVRNLGGNLTLAANVRGADIDLVTAGTLQNIAGASLLASGEWRVWANTWVGETRGGLAGSGSLPNLYGCAYQGQCGVTVPGTDNHFIYVQQPTATVTFGNATREYGLPNPLFTFNVSGAILGDTGANVASGTATTTATSGSNVGNYPITGNFTSLAGYRIQLVPGNLAITPATLLFTADSFVRYLGTANPLFTGTVTGFRNGDTVQSVFGSGVIWSSPAGILTPIGFYPVNGGTTATNYVFAQAPGNATALQIIPLPQLSSTPIDLIRETVNTYVYDRNFGGAPVCAVNASLEDQQLVSTGDELSNEWSKVRSRPNLTNCFDTERRNSCGDF